MIKTLQNILESSNNWLDIYEKLVEHNSNISGGLFEYFCKYYYLANLTVAKDYKHVWLYKEAPYEVKEKLNLSQQDHGVDLILENQEGSFTVVQCKFRNDQNSRLSWTKDKIANLFAEADRADFITVFTNASDVDKYSKNKQVEKFNLITLGELIDIDSEIIDRILSIITKKKHFISSICTPREDQNIAIKKVIKGFQSHNRGQLILPCGAGKTLVSLWVREQMNAKCTLILAPSLALLRQIKNEWQRNQTEWLPYLCICSEKDIDKNSDTPVVHTYELGGRVTTKPSIIRKFLELNKKFTIYSTYQSLDAIIKAIKGTKFQFDLSICDEAHKTAGSKLGAFASIHNNNLIPVKKRLYMTATPRIVADKAKDKMGEDIIKYLADMGNPEIFGPEFHRMSFAEAIKKNILVDYRLIAIGISDIEIQDKILNRQFTEGRGVTLNDVANNYALEKVMKKYGATHAITFHSSIRRAEQFKERHKKLYEKVFSSHVNGRQTTNERSVIMNQFKNSHKAVVTNARCLTEGVDIPSIDVVYFCDPKNSKIDIVQASGRALRTAVHRNKKLGYIVVPIFHTNKDSMENTINDSAFKNLITVIRTLCDQDERLFDEINRIQINKGSYNKSGEYMQIENTLSLIAIESFEEKLKKSIFEQIVEKTSDNWVVMYEKLKIFRQKNPLWWPSHQSDNPIERELKQWCVKNRWLFKKGKLPTHQKQALDKIGFLWLEDEKEKIYTDIFKNEIKDTNPLRSKGSASHKQKPPAFDWENKKVIPLTKIAEKLKITTQQLRRELSKSNFNIDNSMSEIDIGMAKGIIRYLRGRINKKKRK